MTIFLAAPTVPEGQTLRSFGQGFNGVQRISLWFLLTGRTR